MPKPGEVGPIEAMPAEQVVKAASMIKQGKMISLAATRFDGMPLFPGHPPFQVLNAVSPRGIRAGGRQPWGPVNDAGLGYMAEYLMCTSHSGAHIDALAHMTVGDDMHWFGGGNADDHLTDHGPSFGDASAMPPFFTRGVLLDVPTYRGVPHLGAGEPVGAVELEDIAKAQGVEVRQWDVVVIRTGYMSLWPDFEAMMANKTAGPDISAADWLLQKGVVATGTDTETYEVQPAPDPGPEGNPQPVHKHLLIDHGIYLMESLDLEELAREKVYEFAFIALPLKIRGATASLVDPIAAI
jgi:kynurenine formamidase